MDCDFQSSIVDTGHGSPWPILGCINAALSVPRSRSTSVTGDVAEVPRKTARRAARLATQLALGRATNVAQHQLTTSTCSPASTPSRRGGSGDTAQPRAPQRASRANAYE
ncbi:hypothetical protein AURDEDRAFT_116314 [Auricularia subglabra TFB-10046 SS5]|nr:hypothetical protein AURDEDRAFT_116314 [Auricularia subglabra TFB-10046 SS5]